MVGKGSRQVRVREGRGETEMEEARDGLGRKGGQGKVGGRLRSGKDGERRKGRKQVMDWEGRGGREREAAGEGQGRKRRQGVMESRNRESVGVERRQGGGR